MEETVWQNLPLMPCNVGERYLDGKGLGDEEKYCNPQNLRVAGGSSDF